MLSTQDGTKWRLMEAPTNPASLDYLNCPTVGQAVSRHCKHSFEPWQVVKSPQTCQFTIKLRNVWCVMAIAEVVKRSIYRQKGTKKDSNEHNSSSIGQILIWITSLNYKINELSKAPIRGLILRVSGFEKSVPFNCTRRLVPSDNIYKTKE